MNRIAARAWITVVLAGLLLIGFVFFLVEFGNDAEQWVMEESSPHVYEGDQMICGVITDRDGILLLDMSGERSYSNSSLLRDASVHWVGDRQGNVDAQLLSGYGDMIAGFDLLNGVYNYGDKPGVVQLSMDATVQATAYKAMGDYKGTVAVYNYKTGEILCAVSTPGFDPDNVPDISQDTTGKYEGLYINRFTQSTYTPGSIFKIVTTAVALETIPGVEAQKFTCNGSYAFGTDLITCEAVHGEQDLKNAFSNSCNCYFAQLSKMIGSNTLSEYTQKFGLTDSLSIDGIQTTKGNFDLSGAPVNVAWSAVGQYNDLVNPASFLAFVGAIANGGEGTSPYMVQQITVGTKITYRANTKVNSRIVSENTAAILRDYMGYTVTTNYGVSSFLGMSICAKTGTAEVGGGKKPNAMLAGFSDDPKYPYAFIVCVEDAGYGKTVCIPIASAVMKVCIDSEDADN